MEAQTDLQTYLERGKQALARGQGRDAAIAYAYAAQMEPDNPLVHIDIWMNQQLQKTLSLGGQCSLLQLQEDLINNEDEVELLVDFVFQTHG